MTTELTMIHPSGVTKFAYDGWSVPAFLFGSLVPLFRGDLKWFAFAVIVGVINYALCGIIIGFLTTPIWWWIFADRYNEWHKNDLLLQGFTIQGTRKHDWLLKLIDG